MARDNLRLGARSFQKDAERLMLMGWGQGAIPPAAQAGLWYRIWVVHTSGATAQDFPVSDAGLTAALAAAASGDDIYVPPAALTIDFTIPAGVTLTGYGTLATVFTGQVTLTDGSFLRHASVNRTGSGSGALTGIIGPATGHAYLNTVSVIITQSGAGDATALDTGDNKLDVRGSYFGANANSGDAIGVKSGAGDDVNLYDCTVIGLSTSGVGYGWMTGTGSPFMDSGVLLGAIAPATGALAAGFYVGDYWESLGFARTAQSYDSNTNGARHTLENRLAGLMFYADVGISDIDLTGARESSELHQAFNSPNSLTGAGALEDSGWSIFATNFVDLGLTYQDIVDMFLPAAEHIYQFDIGPTYAGMEIGYNFAVGAAIHPSGGTFPPPWPGSYALYQVRPIYYGTPLATDTTLRMSGVRTDADPRSVPTWGDRSAWDAALYPALHTNDTDTAAGLHHTIGSGPNQVPAGDHDHNDRYYTEIESDARYLQAADLAALVLDDLADVDAAAPGDGDILTWDTASGTWMAKPASGFGGDINTILIDDNYMVIADDNGNVLTGDA